MEEDSIVHAREVAGAAVLRDLFHDILEALAARNLLQALETADAVADLKDREKQKSFCRLASEDLRRIFLVQKVPDQAVLPEGENEWFARMAKSFAQTFPRKANDALQRALVLLERNVNQKILFTDLVSKLYISL